MSKAHIGLTTKDLSIAQAREIAKTYVLHLAEVMDAQIERNNASGQNCASIDLPTEFRSVSGVAPRDMQLLVYTDLIKLYSQPITMGGKGFEDVKYDGHDISKPKLDVRWQIGLSAAERESRMALLMNASIGGKKN